LSGGNISSDGGSAVTSRGICWSTATSPTIAGSHTTDGTGVGVFASSITGLTANTVYYIRAYATNFAGTSYGNELTFTTTTSSTALPTVTTTPVTAITTVTAAGGGNVTADGGATVTARGVCWATTANPVATGNHTTDGTGTGIFTSAITGLTAGATYHVRAYAVNSVGTAYGSDLIFTTTTGSGPDVYVLVTESNGTGDVIKLFKNGVPTNLTSGAARAEGRSLFVSGTDVYASGYEDNGTTGIAKLWKNGVATNSGGTTRCVCKRGRLRLLR
jgi:hypothetical protein